jgi:ribosomal protein L11 methyltransferase
VSSFVLKISADCELFRALFEEDHEFSLVQEGEYGLVYSEAIEPLRALIFELPESEYKIEALSEESWRDTWTKDLKPITISELNFVLTPNTESNQAEDNSKNLHLIPGRSFGIGHHETTQLTLQLMGRYSESFKNKNVLDFGCGSGVLGIVAAKLGAKRVLCVDIDDEALRVTQVNAERNNASAIETATEITGTFDVLLINTLKSVMKETLPRIKQHLEKGCLVFASGFLVEEGEEVGKLLGVYEVDYLNGEEWGALEGNIKV